MTQETSAKKEQAEILDYVEKVPKKLYKYYKPNVDYDEKRLSGELFFSSPLKFNDLLDSQLVVENNTAKIVKSRGEKWLKNKLEELGYSDNQLAEELINNEPQAVQQVYNRQLERLGILCLTKNSINPLMWGHYTDNKGYCIEYDTEGIIKDIVIDFANQLSTDLIYILFNKKRYCEEDRDKESMPDRYRRASNLFKSKDLTRINNSFLLKQKENEQLSFLKNLYIKRCWGRLVKYEDKLEVVRPTLFFEKGNKTITKKYYVKSRAWKGEAEYRFILSLGGNKSISIGPNRIKSITFGYHISPEDVIRIISILKGLNKFNSNMKFYRITRTEDNVLDLQVVDLETIDHLYNAAISSYDDIQKLIQGVL